jgi:arsenate reductase
MTITIYHNPACGTSRNTLELIRAAGIEPTVIEYLKQSPSRAKLLELSEAMGITPRGLLRRKEPMYHELGLDDPVWTDDQLLDAMLQHPKLIERPIVVSPLGTKICRPATLVHELLAPGVS